MESKYKPGDKVIVIERKGESSDYPLGFVDCMCKYSGSVVTIKEVKPVPYNCKNRKFYNGDNFYYYIKEDKNSYLWHSSMFMNAKSLYNVGDKVTIVERKGSEFDYPFNFTKGMNELAGKTFIVSEVEPAYIDPSLKYSNGDNYKYLLEGSMYSWHSSMFKTTTQKVNNLQNTKNHENRFQKPKASVRRGSIPKGRTVCGRTNKARVTVKHLSNKPVYC